MVDMSENHIKSNQSNALRPNELRLPGNPDFGGRYNGPQT